MRHLKPQKRTVKEALTLKSLPEISGKIYLTAIGKAGWQMADAAVRVLGDRIHDGVCITKYGHIKGTIPHVWCFEAGHPVPDENTIIATREAEKMMDGMSADDLVLFLISGGGSPLFEDPEVSLAKLQDLTRQLLACGADIKEINTIRKRLSRVKGGRFALHCAPANVFSIVLSDVLGDPLDMIASGLAYPDSTTCEDALHIIEKYQIHADPEIHALLKVETPKTLNHVTTYITGSVRQLCISAENTCRELGYQPVFLTSSLHCVAKEAGGFLSSIAVDHQDTDISLAYICGGETVVQVTGQGKGGRNQEIVLSAAEGIEGMDNVCLFSIGSDTTDGPIDAAGGICTGQTALLLKKEGISIRKVLQDNDAYHALERCNRLIFTGPAGTNVNDLTVLPIQKKTQHESNPY